MRVLAAMRVDSCTAELKNCLQDKDRCGSDYTQCVGAGYRYDNSNVSV